MLYKIACILLLSQYALCGEDYSNGFGKYYKWKRDIDTALAEGKACGKPVMIIIHKSWCPKCVELASRFSHCKSIQELSDNFVMVNCEDDDEPTDPEYSPDGNYIPRVLFFSKDGEPLHCINKWGNPDYKYYFYNPTQIENCMKEVLAKHC